MGVSIAERIQNYRNWFRIKRQEIRIQNFARQNNRHGDIGSHIIISGIYRGGTTWLAEILNRITGYPVIWEPLHRKISPEIIKLRLDWKISVPENDPAADIKAYLDQVLAGKILSRPLIKLTDLKAISASDHLIFKFCRLNMLLPWFMKNYPRARVIYLVRNPYAVVASQLEHPAWSKDFNFDFSFPVPSGKYCSYFEPYKPYLDSLTTKAERLAADWSLDISHVQNSGILQHSDRVLLIYYENLLLQPEETIQQILSFYELEHISTANIQYTLKSFSSLENSSTIDPDTQINKWESKLSREEIEKIYAVTKHFGVSDIYGKASCPLSDLT